MFLWATVEMMGMQRGGRACCACCISTSELTMKRVQSTAGDEALFRKKRARFQSANLALK